jgi:hypothetical protein
LHSTCVTIAVINDTGAASDALAYEGAGAIRRFLLQIA